MRCLAFMALIGTAKAMLTGPNATGTQRSLWDQVRRPAVPRRGAAAGGWGLTLPLLVQEGFIDVGGDGTWHIWYDNDYCKDGKRGAGISNYVREHLIRPPWGQRASASSSPSEGWTVDGLSEGWTVGCEGRGTSPPRTACTGPTTASACPPGPSAPAAPTTPPAPCAPQTPPAPAPSRGLAPVAPGPCRGRRAST